MEGGKSSRSTRCVVMVHHIPMVWSCVCVIYLGLFEGNVETYCNKPQVMMSMFVMCWVSVHVNFLCLFVDFSCIVLGYLGEAKLYGTVPLGTVSLMHTHGVLTHTHTQILWCLLLYAVS